MTQHGTDGLDEHDDNGTLVKRGPRNEQVASAAASALGQKGVRAALVVVTGDDAGLWIALGEEAATLGTGAQAGLRIGDPAVAAAHAQVAFDQGQWVVRALSGGQVFVNDLPVEEFALRDGDRLRLGRTVVKLLASGDLALRYTEELFRAETHDAITSALTRGLFEEALDLEVHRARRYGQPLALVMLDVDHFKTLNARHGEAVGTLVLQRLTARLRTHLRRRDLLARQGDDEWAVLLPEADQLMAHDVAQRLRMAVESERIATASGEVRVTVTAAVALLEAGDDAQSLIQRAQRAVDEAQADGANRVADATTAPAPTLRSVG